MMLVGRIKGSAFGLDQIDDVGQYSLGDEFDAGAVRMEAVGKVVPGIESHPLEKERIQFQIVLVGKILVDAVKGELVLEPQFSDAFIPTSSTSMPAPLSMSIICSMFFMVTEGSIPLSMSLAPNPSSTPSGRSSITLPIRARASAEVLPETA